MIGVAKRRLAAIGWGAFLLLLVLVRLVGLNTDAPAWLSWSTGTYTDEGFYSLDARHEALFGTGAAGSFHDRLLSPLLSKIQQAVFTLFGPGIVQARLISVVFGLLTVMVFWWGLKRAYNANVAAASVVLLGLAPPLVFYNRLALQETPTVFWLVLTFALWASGLADKDGKRQAAMAGVSAALAIVFKPLAALGVIGWATAARRVSLGQRWAGGIGFLLILAIYSLVWYAPHHAELARMATFYRVHQMQPHSLAGLWLNIRRGFSGGERGVVPYLLMTLPVPSLLAAWGLWRLRSVYSPADRFLTVWLGMGLLFCLLSSYAPSRYYVLFLPALLGLAARGLFALRQPFQIAALALFLLSSAFWYGLAWTERSTVLRDAGQALAQTLPAGSVVIGEFAPALCLDTKLAAAPVQPGLSNDDHPVERLHADYIVVTRAPVWETWWHTRYPAIVQPSHRVATFRIGGRRLYVVDVYSVHGR